MVNKILKQGIKVIAVVLLFVYLPNIPPHAKFSESLKITPASPFVGKLALNERLNNADITFKGTLHGPEAFAIYNGELYTTVKGGEVVKIVGNDIVTVVKFGKPCKGFYQEHICGRPLGITIDKNGILYAADAYYGIFRGDVKTGKYRQIITVDEEIGGKKPKLPNSLAVAKNGDIYWTDSSTEFALNDGVFDGLADGSGRVIHYDAKADKNRVLLDNIHFANGIILSKDESFLIISETARNRLLRYYLKGPKKGTSDVFLDGLPGLPDNLQSDGQGGFFAPIVLPVDSDNPQISQSLAPFPLVRKFVARILGLIELAFKLVDQIYPNEWAEKGVYFVGSFNVVWDVLPKAKRVTVLQISESGQIIDSFHALDGKIAAISDVIVFNDKLYLGSPHNDFLGQIPLSKVRLQHLATTKHDVPKATSEETTASTQEATKAPSKTTPPPPKATTPPPSKATLPPPPKDATPKAKPVEDVKPTPKSPPPTKQLPTTPPPSKPKVAPTTQPPPPAKAAPTTAKPVPTPAKPTPTPIPAKATPTTEAPAAAKTSTPTNAGNAKPQTASKSDTPRASTSTTGKEKLETKEEQKKESKNSNEQKEKK